MSDPRVQTDEPHEPLFESGAFHIEATGDGAWCVYDSFVGRAYLYFPTDTEAIDATIALDAAAEVDEARLEAEYAHQLTKARQSMGQVE